MAYEKQTWVTGEVITKEKLNHMEDGIADSGGVIVAEEDSDAQLDKTWQEICDALSEKKQVYVYAHRLLGDDEFETRFEPVCAVKKEFVGGDTPEYEFYVYTAQGSYMTDSSTGYPVNIS